MKYLLLIVAVMLASQPVWAMCQQQTIFMPDGRVLICQTCGSTTTCF